MPWDDTALVVADLVRSGQEGEEEISIDESSRRVVAGGRGKGVSAMEPVWFADPSGGSTEFKLAFVSDESGWWNVYVDGEGGGEKEFFLKSFFAFLFFFLSEDPSPSSPSLTFFSPFLPSTNPL